MEKKRSENSTVMLSVCITTYNTERDIDAALESVFAQETSFAFEVLIGDDGSTDGTIEKIAKWQVRRPGRIHLFRWNQEEAAAQAERDFIARASRNRLRLMERARGTYITFLDGDDAYADPYFYERAVQILEQHPDISICGGRTEMLFPNGTRRPLELSPWRPGRWTAEDYWAHQYTHAEACILCNDIDMEALPPQYRDCFDDNLIVLAVFARLGGGMYCLPDTTALYRQHPGSSFFSRPPMERCLLDLLDIDTEIAAAPALGPAAITRHAASLRYVQANIDEVTKQRYPQIYAQAQSKGADTVLALFQNAAVRRSTRKIRVVFLCYRPAIWIGVKSIYEAMMADPAFDVTIVAIPIKLNYYDGGFRYVSEGAEDYFKDFDCRVVCGYDAGQDAWTDLERLHPDYVFYLQPYNINLPRVYNTHLVSQYAKICYVPYGMQILGSDTEESVLNPDFFSGVTFFFAGMPGRRAWMQEHGRCIGRLRPENILFYGYTRLDHLEQYLGKESKSWHLGRDRMRVLWMPRWCTSEGNCNFFRYKDDVLAYASRHEADVEWLFRPHPQMWKEFVATGEMPEAEQQAYLAQYDAHPNAFVDEQQAYTQTFYASDVLVADGTSAFAEYFMTGKPIIYCHKERDNFTAYGRQLAEGYYIANDWQEVEAWLDMLQAGFDPLASRRQKMRKELLPAGDVPAGERIKEKLKEDFHAETETAAEEREG